MFSKKKRKYTRHHDRFADGYAIDLSPEVKKSIVIISLVAVGGLSLLSLFGLAGFLGAYINSSIGLLFGWLKIMFPLLLLILAFLLYNEDKKWIHGYTYVGVFFFILSLLSLLHIFFEDAEKMASLGKGGGYVGLFLVKIIVSVVGFWGGLLILLCLLLTSIVLIFNSTISGFFGEDGFFSKLFAPIAWLFGRRGRDGEYEDDEEEDFGEGEDKEEMSEEEAEYEEDEEGGEEFISHKVSDAGESLDEIDGASHRANEDKKIAHKKSNIKIDLPLDLLSSKIGKPSGADIKNSKEIIKRTMENFGIPVEMGEVSVGPTVTQYTFKPADGVKLTRITSLSNDLALALAMHPIRIEAPIPGKSLVGIEVPNRVIARVGLREILDTPEFKNRKYNTMISLGKDVAGQAWMANLAKMPHLLVAGATGSGKSVCLNSIIISLLYQNNPDDLKFIMVDPKRVELPIYNGIPYLLTPVITDVPKTINALKWCLNEMDRRFDILAGAGKRNIENYNASGREKMPYIIFIIDELADLMVAAARDVEGAIIRLAQMARAVGIHLILATQRPSVDIITGLIKANIPARIAFSVSSSIDSRTILDVQGAEKLLGQGDMLFITAELSKPKRIQGAFVSDKEIKNINRYIKDKAGDFNYDEEIVGRQKVGGVAGAGFNDEDSDDLYEEAKEIVINSGKASTSFLQRRLRVGYARAARLIDLLEENGVVGPSNGAKAREILITKEEYGKVAQMGPAGMPLHNREEAEFSTKKVFGDEDEARSGKLEASNDDEDWEEDEPDEEETEDEESDEEEEEDESDENEENIDEDSEEEKNMLYSEVLEEEDEESAIVVEEGDEVESSLRLREGRSKKLKVESKKDLPPVAEGEDIDDDEEEGDDEEGDEEMERIYSR